MDIKRILTALIGLPVVVLVILFGNKYVVDVLFSLVAMLCLYEYFKAFDKKTKPIKWVGYVSCVAIAAMHIIPANLAIPLLIAIIPTIITILFLHVIVTEMKINYEDMSITFMGITYIVVLTAFIPVIKAMNNGDILIWYLFIASWGTDTFAYLTGKAIGKHKFSKISPKKSIEGCIGGLIGAVLLGLCYTYIVNNIIGGIEISYLNIAVIVAVLSLLSQIGDFAASCIKRYVEIKDYGNLLPGHGGMLDRIDSVIFCAPFAYLLLTLI